jgi:uncharacterized protein (DUF1330 family)
MAAYLMVQSTISNEGQYQKYREAVVPLIMKFGGKFVIRGGKVEPSKVNLTSVPWSCSSFPSVEAIHASGIRRNTFR